jgi:hypothetical protein
MPFFLARKRNAGAPRGSKQVNTEYERAAPSAFRYYPFFILTAAHMLLSRFLSTVFAVCMSACVVRYNPAELVWEIRIRDRIVFRSHLFSDLFL